MDLLLHILNDPVVNHIIQLLSFIIVISKIVPALRFLGLGAQAIILVLQATRWWLKTNPQGKIISARTDIDERVHNLILKHDSEVNATG